MKIDFVITWVDGNDPKWQEERNIYSETKQDVNPARFRDWGTFKYWFRAVEKFAPWVNKIHLITYGHIPDFLDINHPKLNIVKHEDYLKPEYLPTFNSNAIELSMHRIKDLSEHFVYFNDDTFIIKPVDVEDFFENGLPKDVAILNPIVAKRYDSIANVMLNNMGVINQNFDFRNSFKKNWKKWISFKYGKLILLNILFLPWRQSVGLYQQHIAASFTKSLLEEVWVNEFDLLDNTSKQKFRNDKTGINQWLFKKWTILKGEFSPRKVAFGKYIMINSASDVKSISSAINSKANKMICVNDHINDDFDTIIYETNNVFESILGEKSSFEL